MEYERGAFFSEHEAADVSGITIIEVNEDSEQYRIAEKWERDDKPERWLTYWIRADALAERIEEDHVSYKQQLSEKQLNGVLNLADVETDYQKAVA